MNERTYRNAMDNVKQSADFEQKTLEKIARASERKDQKSRKGRALCGMAAAMSLIVAVVFLLPLFRGGTAIDLPNSSQGITAEYVEDSPKERITAKLLWFTEEELFTHPSAIFMGTVTEARNIKVSMGSDITYYWAIVKIKAEEVYRGDVKKGDIVKVLLRCPVEKGEIWIEDTGVVAAIKQGMKGIFMPTAFKNDEVVLENGTKLTLSDLADYGFQDGQRYAFLETKDSLIYDQSAYPSLAGAKTLLDVKAFVMKMIGTQ